MHEGKKPTALLQDVMQFGRGSDPGHGDGVVGVMDVGLVRDVGLMGDAGLVGEVLLVEDGLVGDV